MGVDNIGQDLVGALMPYASETAEAAKLTAEKSGLYFAHYTSSDAFLKILNSNEVWFRNAAVMNDFMEVEYGLRLLTEAWEHPVGRELKSVLDRIEPSIFPQIMNYHNGWQPSYAAHTYLFSLSEHAPKENKHGRLSMWREYARNAGVAILFNNEVFRSETNLLKAYTVPVMYANTKQFISNFEQILERIKRHEAEISGLAPEILFNAVFQSMRFMALSTKHPGFGEEREWRVIYNPQLESSPFFTNRVEVIGGIPQRIHALQLKEIAEFGETLDLRMSSLLHRVIIGPTAHRNTTQDAIIQALSNAGITEPEKKVTFSDIPVRV